MTPFMAERGTRLASTTFADFVDIGVLNSGNVYARGGETMSVGMYEAGGSRYWIPRRPVQLHVVQRGGTDPLCGDLSHQWYQRTKE